MSHYSVLVVGDDPDALLAPFDENLQTEPRRDPLPIEDLQSMLEHYRTTAGTNRKTKVGRLIFNRYQGTAYPIVITAGRVVEPDHSIVRALWQEWDRRELFRDDAGYYTFTRRNPHAKWDWYAIGGRFTGYFRIKPGRKGKVGEPGLMTPGAEAGWVDQCRKGDVDADFMQNAVASTAADHWDQIHEGLQGHPVERWEALRDRICGSERSQEKVAVAREAYREQPGIVALTEAGLDTSILFDDTILTIPRDEYIRHARDGAMTPYAILIDGEWIERGTMGWFGIGRNEESVADWNRRFMDLYASIPDEALLTLVDCHI